ncbi:collagen binding domain-containing protein [Fructobacillus durionis]|uniref:Collagen binding domain-containing protein n=1 Tax=Fructobacillus durionis TaxID=283737 RepID=A0A1I1EC44_9LACO|nr:collagen binding domain-containing protein [Fructobacillus durionis]SFB82503.1 Collagen binding domain-containing protein [Fructobacillus durionis]
MGIKHFLITAAAFLLAAVVGLSVLRSEADAFNKYITGVELTDLDNKKAKSYGPYDNMQIKWDFSVPKGTELKAGDSMDVIVPKVFNLEGVPDFDIKDNDKNVIAHCTTAANRLVLVVTWTDEAVKTLGEKNLDGYFYVNSKWKVDIVNWKQEIPIDWDVPGMLPSHADITPAPPSPNPADNKLRKDGGFAGEGPGLIYWVVRANWAQNEIKNAKVTDHVGPGQTLDRSRPIRVIKCKVVGKDVEEVCDIQPKSIKYKSDTEFVVDVGDIDFPVNVFYYTKFDTSLPKGTTFSNSAELSGDDYETQKVTAYTSSYSGSGSSDGPGGTPVNPTPGPSPKPDPKPTPSPSPSPAPAPSPKVQPVPSPKVRPKSTPAHQQAPAPVVKKEEQAVGSQAEQSDGGLPETAANWKLQKPVLALGFLAIVSSALATWFTKSKKN